MGSAVAAVERTHEQKLDLLAEVAVKVGLGLKEGQELVMTASLDAVALARRITEQAYRAGASLVTTLYTDDEATLMRYHYAPDAAFDKAAKWLYDGMARRSRAERPGWRSRREIRRCCRMKIRTRWGGRIGQCRRHIVRRLS